MVAARVAFSIHEALQEMLGAELLLQFLGDNQACNSIIKNSGGAVKTAYMKRTQRISLAWLREHVAEFLVYVSTTEQLADICTKGMPREPFEYLRGRIGVRAATT